MNNHNDQIESIDERLRSAERGVAAIGSHLVLLYIAVLMMFILLGVSAAAHAEKPNAKVTARRGYSMTFRIKFPWGTCTTRYYHPTVRYPVILRGNACGTRTTCYRVFKGPKYNCIY
jgi:hypothetical protein